MLTLWAVMFVHYGRNEYYPNDAIGVVHLHTDRDAAIEEMNDLWEHKDKDHIHVIECPVEVRTMRTVHDGCSCTTAA